MNNDSKIVISYVIPSYNRADGMIELLSSIFEQDLTVNFEVIVVDDCSPDNTNCRIKELFPKVLLIENDVNSGPAISRDKGIRVAKGEFIIGIDSDVLVQDKNLSTKVINYFKNNLNVGMVAFKLLTPNQDDDSQRWWHSKPLATHSNKSFETDYFSGTGYAVRKSAYCDSGGFSSLLYMHYEEVLLAYRFIDSGYEIYYEPTLVVVHNALPTTRRNKMKMFYKPRNQLIVATECFPFARAIVYLTPRLGKNLLTALMNWEIKEYFSAIRNYLTLRKKILKNRKILKPSTFEKLKKLRA